MEMEPETNIKHINKDKLEIEKMSLYPCLLYIVCMKKEKGVSKDIKSFNWLKELNKKKRLYKYLQLGTRYEDGFGTLRI